MKPALYDATDCMDPAIAPALDPARRAAAASVPNDPVHVMVDLETMGPRPGSAIASIGACVFSPFEEPIGATFYTTVSLASCVEIGLRLDADTVLWWMGQSDAARAALSETPCTINSALCRFSEWLRLQKGSVHLWCHGASFDEPILSAAYHAAGLGPVPWDFRNIRDTRTVFWLSGIKPDRNVGVHHNALDDAVAQARAVTRAVQALGGRIGPAGGAEQEGARDA